MGRFEDLRSLYAMLDTVRHRSNGYHQLSSCGGEIDSRRRGVYFFFQPEELRRDGTTLRIVRVGTHAISGTSRTTLWDRLRQHRGTIGGAFPGGGNHRCSVFRYHLGMALIERDQIAGGMSKTWPEGSTAPSATRILEAPLERSVSELLSRMPFLCVYIDDAPGKDSHRRVIERNVIALLSNLNKEPIDPPSSQWLGRYSPEDKVRNSGLWNVNHVCDQYDPRGLELLGEYVVGSTRR